MPATWGRGRASLSECYGCYGKQALASELAGCSDCDGGDDGASSPAVVTAMALATVRARRPGCSDSDCDANVERATKSGRRASDAAMAVA